MNLRENTTWKSEPIDVLARQLFLLNEAVKEKITEFCKVHNYEYELALKSVVEDLAFEAAEFRD